MARMPDISRWLLPPGRAAATHTGKPAGRPGRGRSAGTLISAGVLTLAVAVTASASLAAGTDDAKPAAAQQRAATPRSDYLRPVGTLVQQGTLPTPTPVGETGSVGVPPKTAPRPTKPVDLAVGRTAAQYSGRAGTLTPAGIATLAMQRGCSSTQAVIATAVAMAESGGSPSAQGDITLMDGTWDWSAGLWQIRGLRAQRNTGGLRDAVANQNAVTNSVAMYAISNSCTNWVPWSTYNNGAYRAYLTIASRAVNYVIDYYRTHHRYPAVAAPDPNATVPMPDPGAYAAAQPARTSAGSGAKSSAAPKPKASSSKAAARSSAAAAGGNDGAGAASSSRAAAKPSPKPSSSTKKRKIVPSEVEQPVKSITSAVGAVTSTVKSVVPTCVPLVTC